MQFYRLAWHNVYHYVKYSAHQRPLVCWCASYKTALVSLSSEADEKQEVFKRCLAVVLRSPGTDSILRLFFNTYFCCCQLFAVVLLLKLTISTNSHCLLAVLASPEVEDKQNVWKRYPKTLHAFAIVSSSFRANDVHTVSLLCVAAVLASPEDTQDVLKRLSCLCLLVGPALSTSTTYDNIW